MEKSTYFESVEYYIEFNSVLTTNGVVDLAGVGEGAEDHE